MLNKNIENIIVGLGVGLGLGDGVGMGGGADNTILFFETLSNFK